MEKKIINIPKYIKHRGKPIIIEIGFYTICMTLRSLWRNNNTFCLQGDGCILLKIDQEKARHAHLDFNHDTLPILVYRGSVTTMVPLSFNPATCLVRELTQEEHKTYKSALHSLMYKTKKPYFDSVPPPTCTGNNWALLGYTRVF